MLWADGAREEILRRIFPDVPPVLTTKTEWYYIDRRIDYRDNVTLTTVDMIIDGKDEIHWAFEQKVCLYFYPKISSVGEVIENIKKQESTMHWGKTLTWAIVSPDDYHAELFERQKIRFIKPPPEVTII